MNSGTRLGLTNIQFSSDGENWQQLGTTQQVELEIKEQDNNLYDFVKCINEPVAFSCTLHKKKNGTYIEKCLYYMNSKKKRIRKKYSDKFHYLLGFRKQR